MRLGFTGTQRGMTEAQLVALGCWLGKYDDRFTEFHHGDCIGADSQFHDEVVASVGRDRTVVVIHPPEAETKRAWCASHCGRALVKMRPRRPYLVRNHDIVIETDMLCAAPAEMVEQLRSGTWATIRYARKLGRRIRLFWPDGTSTLEVP